RALPHRHRHRLCRSPGRWSPGNLADPQQAISRLAASPLLRGHRKCAERTSDPAFLRTLGIEITFSREDRTGTRMIRLSTSAENTVSTVSAARSNGSRGDQAILPEVGE